MGSCSQYHSADNETPDHRLSLPAYRLPLPVYRPSFPVHRLPLPDYREPSPVHRASPPVNRPPFTVYRKSSTIHRPTHAVLRESFAVYGKSRPNAHRLKYNPAVIPRDLQQIQEAAKKLPPEDQIQLAEFLLDQARSRQKTGKPVDLNKYAGTVAFPEDALEYQQRIRAEWER